MTPRKDGEPDELARLGGRDLDGSADMEVIVCGCSGDPHPGDPGGELSKVDDRSSCANPGDSRLGGARYVGGCASQLSARFLDRLAGDWYVDDFLG